MKEQFLKIIKFLFNNSNYADNSRVNRKTNLHTPLKSGFKVQEKVKQDKSS